MRPIGRVVSIVLTIALPLLFAAPNAEAKPKKATAAKRAEAPKKKKAKTRQAPPAPRPEVTVEDAGEGGYAYSFDDDPLHAMGNGATGAQIRVRPQGVRNTLIRPRLNFIPELLKSVENL